LDVAQKLKAARINKAITAVPLLKKPQISDVRKFLHFPAMKVTLLPHDHLVSGLTQRGKKEKTLYQNFW